MGEKLDNPPLIYALGQVIFNPVKGMGQFVPALQELLRANFPDFKEEIVTVQHFPVAAPPGVPPQVIQVAPQTICQWHFLDFERTSGYMLSENTFIFHTTAYETNSVFLEKIRQGLTLVHEKAKLSFIERLGLRFINAVYMNDKEDDILHPSLRGMVPAGSGEYLQTFSESVLERGNAIQLLVRAIRSHHAFPLPDGFASLPLQLPTRELEHGQSVVSLDLDCSRQKREKFSMEYMHDTFSIMHSYIETAFHLAVKREFFTQER